MSQNESPGGPSGSNWGPNWASGRGGCPCRPSLGYVPVRVSTGARHRCCPVPCLVDFIANDFAPSGILVWLRAWYGSTYHQLLLTLQVLASPVRQSSLTDPSWPRQTLSDPVRHCPALPGPARPCLALPLPGTVLSCTSLSGTVCLCSALPDPYKLVYYT